MSLQTSRRTVAKCLEYKLKINRRKMAEELIPLASDYTLKLTSNFSQ